MKNTENDCLTISYRYLGKTSKISIQPSLFKHLSTFLGGSVQRARAWIPKILCDARDQGLTAKYSSFVTEEALLMVLPSSTMSGFTSDLSMRHTIWVFLDGERTKVSLPGAMKYFADRYLQENNAKYFHLTSQQIQHYKGNKRNVSEMIRAYLLTLFCS